MLVLHACHFFHYFIMLVLHAYSFLQSCTAIRLAKASFFYPITFAQHSRRLRLRTAKMQASQGNAGNALGQSSQHQVRCRAGVILLIRTPPRVQLADIGTKACPAPQLKFQRLARMHLRPRFENLAFFIKRSIAWKDELHQGGRDAWQQHHPLLVSRRWVPLWLVDW